MVSCVYIKTLFNFIFPYSYAAVYSLSGFLLSALSGLLFIRDKKTPYLFLSFFFAGFAFANKIEYAPYFLFLFVVLLFHQKPVWKKIAGAAGSFLVMPAISFGILFIQGIRPADLYEAFKLINDIIKTPALDYFYRTYGLYFSKDHFLSSIYIFGKLLLFFIPTALILYGLNFIGKKYLNSKLTKTVFNFSIFVLLSFTSIKVFKLYLDLEIYFFTWIGILCCFILLCFGAFYLIKWFKNKFRPVEIPVNDLMYLFFLISSILVSIKGISWILTECYGTFSIAVLSISLVVFLAVYIPKFLKFLDAGLWNKTVVNIFFIVTLLLFGGVFKTHIDKKLYPVKTNRGLIFIKESISDVRFMVYYIQNNTPKDAVILSMPEGSIINFLTDRKSDDRYYYLIPVNVQLFGEDKIVKDLKNNPPDYFLLYNMQYICFNAGSICQYGSKICDFIQKDYTLEASTNGTNGSALFSLYKRKQPPSATEKTGQAELLKNM
jgi:hypothetical protein